MGLVTVNGETITEMGHKVKITDEVRYEGKRLKAEKPVYILLNSMLFINTYKQIINIFYCVSSTWFIGGL